jgi:hypothetical protein
MPFSRGQNAFEADHKKIADQMGVNVLWAPTHVFLLEAIDTFADRSLDFAPRLHENSLHMLSLF